MGTWGGGSKTLACGFVMAPPSTAHSSFSYFSNKKHMLLCLNVTVLLSTQLMDKKIITILR